MPKLAALDMILLPGAIFLIFDLHSTFHISKWDFLACCRWSHHRFTHCHRVVEQMGYSNSDVSEYYHLAVEITVSHFLKYIKLSCICSGCSLSARSRFQVYTISQISQLPSSQNQGVLYIYHLIKLMSSVAQKWAKSPVFGGLCLFLSAFFWTEGAANVTGLINARGDEEHLVLIGDFFFFQNVV